MEHDMGTARRKKIIELVKGDAYLEGDFVLSSGAKSKYYWDSKMALTKPEALCLIADEILEILKDIDVDAIGGLTIGAALMVPTVALRSYQLHRPIQAFVVRDRSKEHGTKKLIEGQFPKKKGAKIVIVDDVVTTGGSIRKARDAVEEQGCRVVKVIALLDRHEGGSEDIRRDGFDFTAILHRDLIKGITVEEPLTVTV